MTYYALGIYKSVYSESSDDPVHTLLGSYDCGTTPPWVPRKGDFFRFRDPYPPNLPHDHTETAGRVSDVVTVFYGTRVTIEVYITPQRTASE